MFAVLAFKEQVLSFFCERDCRMDLHFVILVNCRNEAFDTNIRGSLSNLITLTITKHWLIAVEVLVHVTLSNFEF